MRHAVRLVLATFVAAGYLTIAAPASHGLEGEPIVIDAVEGSRVTQDYGPMPVPDTVGLLTTPEDCATTPSCTLVPMEVRLPAGFDSFVNEFFLNMTISWEGNVDLGAAGTQDLDIYIYAKRLDEEGEEEYVEVGRAASAGQPEKTKLFTPDETNYWIVVQNFNGVNTGFRIDVEFVDATIIDPLFAPGGLTRPSSPPSSGNASEPGPSNFDDFSPSAPAYTSPSNLPSLAPPVSTDFSAGLAAAPGDPGLGDFGSFNDFQRELNAGAEPTAIDLLAASRRQLGPASDVAPAVLLFWLLALPIVIAAAGYVMLMRRRPAALTLAA